MAGVSRKNLRTPDEVLRFPGIVEELVDLGDLTVARTVQDPGWRWSTHMRPLTGGEWCQARHVGLVVSGRLGALLSDGATVEFGPDDVYDLLPGHDGYTIGDEPAVLLEWSGVRAFAAFRGGTHRRILATLMFTDLVGSTVLASRLGDASWRELLATHLEGARAALERFRGREVKTTGDGMLATFEGPAQALHCAADICRAALRQGLHVRAGVHVGEVDLVGDDVRGVAVHEAARIMAAAGEDEVLVSDTTRLLASGAGLAFEDRGAQVLKGLPGTWRLFAYTPEAVAET